MSPIFMHSGLSLGVLLVNCLLWRVMETSVDIRTYKRLRAGVQRQDKGSHIVLLCLIVVGLLSGVLIALKVPATAMLSASVWLFWLGMFLMDVGIALRFYSIHVLGVFFTTAVSIAPEQKVIEAGPYRLIRHPSYSGFLLILLGFGLSLTNWLSLLVIMGCALLGFAYRIQVEEQALKTHLGQQYEQYMRHTKRLIPFIL